MCGQTDFDFWEHSWYFTLLRQFNIKIWVQVEKGQKFQKKNYIYEGDGARAKELSKIKWISEASGHY